MIIRKAFFWCGLLSLWLIPTTLVFALNRDTLLPDERNTIEIFEKISPKVVYVHRIANSGKKSQKSDGAGSGLLWDNKGHVVTNYHVIKGADKLAITLGTLTVPAVVIGKEPRKDIALLEIRSPKAQAYLKTIKPFEIAHLEDLIVGQKAVAIGNPFGLDHSLSTGVISALGRKVPGIGGVTIHNMVQTDTPINPGNSGGPLLNSAGQLIGMNTMIFSHSGTSAGIGFAVPADVLNKIVTQLIEKGRVVLSGIGIKPMDFDLARKLGVTQGIVIDKVLPNTPAAYRQLRGTYKNAGRQLVLGDLIVAINGHNVPNYDILYNLLSEIKVGEQITVTIKRGNKKMDVTMKTIDVAGF